MRVYLAIATSILLVFCTISFANAASDEALETFVEEEAYVIAKSLKLTDIVKEKTNLKITAHRVDSSGIHWLAGDVKIVSRKYGFCGVALQLKFIEENEEILIVGSKGVLAALEINRGVEKYQTKLIEYERIVKSAGHAIIIGPE
jgi:hypothetical protein